MRPAPRAREAQQPDAHRARGAGARDARPAQQPDAFPAHAPDPRDAREVGGRAARQARRARPGAPGIAVVAMALAVAGFVVAACSQAMGPPEWQRRQQKMTEITTLWAQIRDWRRAAHMDLDPTPATMFQWRSRPVSEAARVCPDGHTVPTTCSDVCSLADAICDNAEAICGIADELGKSDHDAQEKCTSAKASCREAKQRCCKCSEPAP